MAALSGRRLLMYLGLCVVWGSTWLVIKIGLRDLPPLFFAGIRMAVACALLTPFAFSRGGRSATPSEWRWIAWAGFVQIGVSYACIFLASQWIPSGLTALLFSTFPIFVAFFAHAMLPEEPLTLRTAASAALGLAGVAIIEGPAAVRALAGGSRVLLLGSSLVLASALVSGYANVINKKFIAGVPPPRNVWGQTLVGSVVLLLAAAVFERGQPSRWTPESVGALAYLAVVGTALPFVGLFWLLHRVPVAVIGTIPVVDTVIAVCLGSLILGETFSPRVLGGGVLILAGVLLAALPGRRAAATGGGPERAGPAAQRP